ncbi:MAG: PHP domain-containing protein [Clostridia bacterium]|nr:PHP domain-containing protein [Clostridia bacterium]
MKIDLHLHTSERSVCSTATAEQHICSAIEYGLDAIVITDHDKLVPLGYLIELNQRHRPFRIFGGIEIRIADCGEDVLVLGLQEPVLEQKQWLYGELHEYVGKMGGFICLNHPYRYSNEVRLDVCKYKPDAIEIHSTNIGRCDEDIIKNLARKLNTRLVSNSDAHSHLHTGIFYNDIWGNPKTDAELVAFLKRGMYSLGRDENRIECFNKNVHKREGLIRDLIAQGKTAEDYSKMTGNWAGEYNRVAMGKSYII